MNDSTTPKKLQPDPPPERARLPNPCGLQEPTQPNNTMHTVSPDSPVIGVSYKMTYQEWFGLSVDEAIRQRMADDAYSMAYPALLSHFAGIKILDWDAAVLGLHIVYGWMPTIPKLGAIMRWEDAKRHKLVAALTKAKCGETPTEDELKTLMGFCNNSMVGASKMLHFLNPMAFPIWDSRVAKVFLKNPKAGWQRVNNIEPWIAYRTALCAWVENEEVKKGCEELRALTSFLEGVSDLRLVELVMFHKTVSKRKQEFHAIEGTKPRIIYANDN